MWLLSYWRCAARDLVGCAGCWCAQLADKTRYRLRLIKQLAPASESLPTLGIAGCVGVSDSSLVARVAWPAPVSVVFTDPRVLQLIMRRCPTSVSYHPVRLCDRSPQNIAAIMTLDLRATLRKRWALEALFWSASGRLSIGNLRRGTRERWRRPWRVPTEEILRRSVPEEAW
jgi:hypothetical protein